eukprot:4473623-Prymnesium_polylepis.1
MDSRTMRDSWRNLALRRSVGTWWARQWPLNRSWPLNQSAARGSKAAECFHWFNMTAERLHPFEAQQLNDPQCFNSSVGARAHGLRPARQARTRRLSDRLDAPSWPGTSKALA